MKNKSGDAEYQELRRQVAEFRNRVRRHAERGRFEGTYDHDRLLELERLLKARVEDLKNG